MIEAKEHSINLRPIGIVHSPFKNVDSAPRQPQKARGVEGLVTVFPKYRDGLKDLDGFSHIILICFFHLALDYSLTVIPRDEKELRGLFSTRSPNRPNPLGISIVRLTEIDGCNLQIQDLDIIDGTPLLDIKPFYRSLDDQEDVISGWMNR